MTRKEDNKDKIISHDDQQDETISTNDYRKRQEVNFFRNLEKIGELKQKGILTDEEFQKLKSQLLTKYYDELAVRKEDIPRANQQRISNISIKQDSNLSDFLTYYNYSLGFKLDFPSEWTRERDNLSSTFYSPLTKNNSRVSVAIERLSTPNLYLDKRKDAKIKDLENRYKKFKYTLLESSSLRLAGTEGWKLVYTFSPPREDSIEKMEIWMLYNNKEYNLYYSAYQKDYVDYLDTAQKMIDSFALLAQDEFAIYENDTYGINI